MPATSICAAELRGERLTNRFLKEKSQEEEASHDRDELEGKGKQVKGKIKQSTGDLIDDGELQDEGIADEAEGEVQEDFARARRKIGQAIEDIGEKVKR